MLTVGLVLWYLLGVLLKVVLWFELRRDQKCQKIGRRETSIPWMSYRGFWLCGEEVCCCCSAGTLNTFTETEAVCTTMITIAAESESNWGRLDPEVKPSCSEQGQLEQVAWSCVQLSLEHLQGWKHCSLSGQCVPVFSGSYWIKLGCSYA